MKGFGKFTFECDPFRINNKSWGGDVSIVILNEIKSTEEEAEQIEAEAQQKAREIVASAKKDAAAILEKAVEQAELDTKNIIKSAESKAVQEMDEMKAKIKTQCKIIKESSTGKLEDAVELIVGRIVGRSDR